MEKEVYINGKDAYTTWGISFDTSSLSSLMTPPPMKQFAESNCRLKAGKVVITDNPQIDERQVTLTFNMTARNETQFFSRYGDFCEELKKGILNIRSMYQPDVTYKMIYLSCSQFTQFVRQIASFTLKLNEPNPTDRTE